MYDLSFAKHSVISNLDVLGQNIDHYYSLFTDLLKSTIERLESLMNQPVLKTHLVAKFNVLMDLLTKYIKFYLSLLRGEVEDSSMSAKIHEVFNTSERTLDFIRNELSQTFLTVIGMFMRLKLACSSTSRSGYLFYFDPASNQQEWQNIVMLDKLNSFLSLLFVDFRLGLPNANFNQQLSQFLKESKHWDFLLCYTAEVSQKLSSIKNFVDNKCKYLKSCKIRIDILVLTSF